MEIRRFLFIIPFCILLLAACKNKSTIKNTSENPRKTTPTVLNNTENKTKTEDTVFIELSLTNKIFDVYSKVEGKVIDSELNSTLPQVLDTSTLIVAIDNRQSFLKIRAEKIKLRNEMKNFEAKLSDRMKLDFDKCLALIQNDNFLPEINTSEFSIDFVDWFKSQTFFSQYEKAKKLEMEMEDYFYLNEKPIYLNKVLAKKGDLIQKRTVLYRYLLKEPIVYMSDKKVFFDGKDSFKLYESDSDAELKEFRVANGRIIFREKFQKELNKLKKVYVVFKKAVS